MRRTLALAVLLVALKPFEGSLFRSIASHDVSSHDGRIVGGLETTIAHFPHQVSLQRYGRHICGAAIISPTVVITAAHCVPEQNQPQTFTIRAGSSEHAKNGVIRTVRRILAHEHYNFPSALNNDIAVIQLEAPLPFSYAIQAIALATPTDIAVADTSFYVSGWGATSSTQQRIAQRLRYAVVKVLDQYACVRSYQGAGTITRSMLCAGQLGGGRDSCQGDSGGPLATYIGGVMKLVGIVSWGIGCAHADYPGVYTRVADYDSWVNQTMAKFG